MLFTMHNVEKRTSGVYAVRVVIPKHLHKAAGKTAFTHSLRTKDERTAYIQAGPIIEKFKRQLANLQLSHDGQPSIITTSDVQWIAERAVGQLLDKIESEQSYAQWYTMEDDEADPSGSAPSCEWLEHIIDDLHPVTGLEEDRGYAAVDRIFHQIVADLCEAGAIPLTQNLETEEYRQVLLAVVRQMGGLANRLHERASRIYTPRAFKVHKPSATKARASLKVADSIEVYFQKVSREDGIQKGEVRRKEYGAALRLFASLFGQRAVNTITRADIRKFKDLLHEYPSSKKREVSLMTLEQAVAHGKKHSLPSISPDTVRNKLNHVSGLFTALIDSSETDIESNPCHGVKKPAKTHRDSFDTSKEYSREELETLFSGWWFDSKPFPFADYGPARYWLPVLAYYTGCRREELAALTRKALVFSDEGHYLELSESTVLGRLKTKSSVRRIPLHPDLLDLGLQRYAADGAADGHLFPQLALGANGYGTAIGTRWGKYTREVLTNSAPPLHGFRHTLTSLLRATRAREEEIACILGHSKRSQTERYGHRVMTQLREAIEGVPSVPNIKNLKALLSTTYGKL